MTNEKRDAVRAVIYDNIGNAVNPHSWRCEHTDRFPGYCQCVEEITDEIMATLKDEP